MAVNAFFVILAVAFMIAPPALVFVIDYQLRLFQSEAFGHLRNAARNLRYVIWVVLLYYAGVLFGSIVVGDLPAMFEYPMPARGAQIYVRIGAAIAAYVGVFFVARELFLIARPRRKDQFDQRLRAGGR